MTFSHLIKYRSSFPRLNHKCPSSQSTTIHSCHTLFSFLTLYQSFFFLIIHWIIYVFLLPPTGLFLIHLPLYTLLTVLYFLATPKLSRTFSSTLSFIQPFLIPQNTPIWALDLSFPYAQPTSKVFRLNSGFPNPRSFLHRIPLFYSHTLKKTKAGLNATPMRFQVVND